MRRRRRSPELREALRGIRRDAAIFVLRFRSAVEAFVEREHGEPIRCIRPMTAAEAARRPRGFLDLRSKPALRESAGGLLAGNWWPPRNDDPAPSRWARTGGRR